MNTETMQCDVLVVGGGLAGVRAALAARKAGASVITVLKRRLGASGNSARAGGGFSAALRVADPDDSPEAHFSDTMAGGSQIGNPHLVRLLGEMAPAAILELQAEGVAFATERDQIAQYMAPAQAYRRSVRTAGGGMRQLFEVLGSIARKEGIRLLEGAILLDLARIGDQVVGAFGYVPERDELVAFQAKAVVLACGGAGQLFPLTSNNSDLTGDGYAVAYRAGARLADMEFIQFNPTALAWPLGLRGGSTGGALLGQEGAWLLNRLGERFMARYDLERMERSTRAVTSRAIYREIVEGRGSEHGAVYLDATRVDPTALSHISGHAIPRLLRHGTDPLKDPMEVAPAVHHMMGGVIVDAHCATDIQGLYAAGEVAAGVHGANRLSSNGLSEAVVFGQIAGQEAAGYASRASTPPLPADALERARLGIEAMEKASVDIGPYLERLRSVMLAGAGLERCVSSTEAALACLAGLKAEAVVVGASRPGDIPRIVELRNMLEVGEIILRAVLRRTESRGAHFRTDHPRQNDAEWLANIVVSPGRNGPDLQVVRICR